jgi:two-component system, NtrC family, response regulator
MSKSLSTFHADPSITPPLEGGRLARGKRANVSPLTLLGNEDLPYIVGESARMREIHAIIQKAASWDANVCIEGENGTGKELVARSLHVAGPRRDRPYITLDCSTIAEGLIESHLFGHVRGAFTGAVATRQGVFAQAHTGTLFIDEITELASHLQAKLLRAIQTGEFTMVGGSQPQRVNVRIITATNRDLRQAVAKKTFREDLYFRIAVIRIAMPPLRERREDIPLLVAHFLRGLTSGRRQEIRDLTERAMTALMTYSWPGNVRQLKNWIEQALVLADGDRIDLEHFPSLTRELSETPGASVPLAPLGLRLEELERWYVLETLKRADGNRTKAARQLGISLRGLQYKLRRYATALDPTPNEPDVSVGGMQQWNS